MAIHDLTKQLNFLDAELQALLTFLAQYTDDELNKKPSENAWSVNQVLQHIMIGERGALEYLKKKTTNWKGEIKKASATSRLRAILIATALSQPLKIKAPEIATVGMLDEVEFSKIKEDWLTHRSELRKYLLSLDAALLDADCYKHPVAGKMDAWGMLDFFKSHFQRHEKQIRRTIQAVEIQTPEEVGHSFVYKLKHLVLPNSN